MVTRETSVRSVLQVLGLDERVPDLDLIVERLLTYSDLLEKIALPRGFLGPDESDRLFARHIAEALTMTQVLPYAGRIVDVGSGAGLPGLVLAALGLHEVVLVEPSSRRSAFLRQAAHELGVAVRILVQPAEVAGHSDLREVADAATARAVASPEVALELTLPFVRIGGIAVLPVGAHVAAGADGTRAAAAGVPARMYAEAAAELGGADPGLDRLEVPGAQDALWVMIVEKFRPTPEEYPRRPGIPRRRPLGGGVTGVG
jgi:16S rRNA (guanine527-N7)-methyltransferase